MDEADAVDRKFYWAWVRGWVGNKRGPVLEVVQAQRDQATNKVYWEGCGSDEGASVIEIICAIEPPVVDPPTT